MTTMSGHYMHKHDDNANNIINSHHIHPVESLMEDFKHTEITNVFVNFEDSEEEIYPLTISEIASKQQCDKELNAYFKKNGEVAQKNKRYTLNIIDEVDIVVYDDKQLVIAKTP